MLDPRGLLLRAAVGFAGCSLPSHDRALWALRTWLDSWPGIGRVAAGMHRQGYDLQLTRYDERGWRATFFTTRMEHSLTSATGTPGSRFQASTHALGRFQRKEADEAQVRHGMARRVTPRAVVASKDVLRNLRNYQSRGGSDS